MRQALATIGGTTRYLVWEGDELLLEVGPTGTVLVRHDWGAGGYQGYYRETSLTRLALRDGLGHVRGLMNTSKTITDRYVYDAYGNDVAPNLHNTTEGNALRFRWNGSYPDSFGTGGYRTLYLLTGQQTTNTATIPDLLGTGTHVGARHYSPSLHRWLQRDPVGVGGGDPNTYRYACGSPLGAADPTGLKEEQLSDYDRLLLGAALKLIGQTDPTRKIRARRIARYRIVIDNDMADLGQARGKNCIAVRRTWVRVDRRKKQAKPISEWTTLDWQVFQADAIGLAALLVHEDHHLAAQIVPQWWSKLSYVGSLAGLAAPASHPMASFEQEAYVAELWFLQSLAWFRPDLASQCLSRAMDVESDYQEAYGRPTGFIRGWNW